MCRQPYVSARKESRRFHSNDLSSRLCWAIASNVMHDYKLVTNDGNMDAIAIVSEALIPVFVSERDRSRWFFILRLFSQKHVVKLIMRRD